MENWSDAARRVLALCRVRASLEADDWNHKTIVTFGDSVEIPGQVLPAGTYVFQLLDSSADRHIVQIWTEDQKQLVVTTIHSFSNQRMRPTGRSTFEFDERPPLIHFT